MEMKKHLVAVGVVLALIGSGASAADNQKDLDARVTRLEQKMNSGALVDMLSRLDALQKDVQDLRGQVEQQNHLIEQLKQHQRDLYLDIDRRLSRLERGGSPAANGGSGQVKAPTANAPAQGAAGAASTPVPAQTPAPNSAAEQAAYQKAFDLLRELRYDQAITAFRGFIKQYPKGRYAHIAQYWIAEADYAQRNFKQAITDYQQLIDNYPQSPKVAEAMLKIGYSQYELGDMAKAQSVLAGLVKQYPNTTEAGQAQNMLQQIKRAAASKG